MKKLSVQEWKEMRRRNPTPPVDWSEIWRQHGPKIEEFIQESQKMFHRFNTYFRTISEELQPGTDLGDICIIGHPESSDEERKDAVKRFGERHRYILPGRWHPLAHRLVEAIKTAAAEQDRSAEKTLEMLALAGLYEYSQCIGYAPIDEILGEKDALIWETRLKLSTYRTKLGTAGRKRFRYNSLHYTQPRLRAPTGHPM